MVSRAEVHVWHARMDGTDFRALLSADELARAARFHFSRDRDRFVFFHGVLRTILGRQLGAAPAALRFETAPGGKPYLPGSPLRFNVSHSRDDVLIAAAWEREVGIDIEFLRADVAVSGIAERFFSPGECAALAALPPEDRVRGFFTCWTRKEAYLKARGSGLALPLARFEVTVAPGEAPALLDAPEGAAEVARWKMADVPVPDGFAALVAEGRDWELRLEES